MLAPGDFSRILKAPPASKTPTIVVIVGDVGESRLLRLFDRLWREAEYDRLLAAARQLVEGVPLN